MGYTGVKLRLSVVAILTMGDGALTAGLLNTTQSSHSQNNSSPLLALGRQTESKSAVQYCRTDGCEPGAIMRETGV